MTTSPDRVGRRGDGGGNEGTTGNWDDWGVDDGINNEEVDSSGGLISLYGRKGELDVTETKGS